MITGLTRWDPFRELMGMRAEMDRLMQGAQGESRVPSRWAPSADVIENDREVVITAELPGVKDSDVEITVQDGMLRIAGERHLQDEVSREHYHRIERSYGGFERWFPLPAGVDEGDIHAAIAYGVLRVTIPKPRATEPRRIAVTGD